MLRAFIKRPRIRLTLRSLLLGVAVLAAILAAGIPRLRTGQSREITIPGARVVLVGEEPSIRSLAFSGDGTTLAALGERGSLQAWDVATAWPQASLVPADRHGYGLAIASDGRSVLIGDSAGAETTVRPRSLRSMIVDSVPFRLPGLGSISVATEAADPRPYAGIGIAFSPDGRSIASGGLGVVDIRERSTLRSRKTLNTPLGIPTCLAFSPDARLLGVGDGSGGVTLLDLVGGTARFERPKLASPRPIADEAAFGHLGGVSTLVFTPDSARLVSLGFDNRVKIWDTATGRMINHMKIGEQSGWSHCWSILALVAGGRAIVTASVTGEIGERDLDTGRLRRTGKLPFGPLVVPNHWIQRLAISADGKLLAGAFAENAGTTVPPNARIVLWDLDTLCTTPANQ